MFWKRSHICSNTILYLEWDWTRAWKFSFNPLQSELISNVLAFNSEVLYGGPLLQFGWWGHHLWCQCCCQCSIDPLVGPLEKLSHWATCLYSFIFFFYLLILILVTCTMLLSSKIKRTTTTTNFNSRPNKSFYIFNGYFPFSGLAVQLFWYKLHPWAS